jgi:hypothetical protein
MGHDPLGSNNYDFYGAIDGHGESATYSFVYSTDSTFATSVTSLAKIEVINSLKVVWAKINGLAANTKYFYYLTATTVSGTVNGNHMSFYSDSIPLKILPKGADIYSTGYAELRGMVTGIHFNANISFEYGLTPTMGMTTASEVPSISDSNTHEFRGFPSPLTAGQLYFFRVKAVGTTDSIFSDIMAFYMGYPYSILQVLPATNITDSTADINAQVQGFPVPVKMTTEIHGGNLNHFHTPNQYFDQTSSIINYTYSASGLQADQTFSTRVKAFTWIGCHIVVGSFSTLTTGINDQEDPDFKILTYPVPASNYLTIELQRVLNSESLIQLFNISGQIIKEIKIPSNQKRISLDLTDLGLGSYILKLISGDKVFNRKVVVVK